MPAPFPAVAVFNSYSFRAKVAVMAFAPSMVMVMGFVVELTSPLQPVKTDSVQDVAVRVTTVP